MSSGLIHWRSIDADLLAARFRQEFALFFEYALMPTLRNESMYAPPEYMGSHNLRVGLAMAQLNKHLALAVQSVWESSFRKFVRSSVTELSGAKDDETLRRAPVNDLARALEQHRGVPLDELPGGSLLRELLLVGNVVRHGDGPSCGLLVAAAPGMWLNLPEAGADPCDLADELFVTAVQVESYAEAVFEFWHAVSATHSHQHPVELPPWMKANGAP